MVAEVVVAEIDGRAVPVPVGVVENEDDKVSDGVVDFVVVTVWVLSLDRLWDWL